MVHDRYLFQRLIHGYMNIGSYHEGIRTVLKYIVCRNFCFLIDKTHTIFLNNVWSQLSRSSVVQIIMILAEMQLKKHSPYVLMKDVKRML